jgi:hypothetical protein
MTNFVGKKSGPLRPQSAVPKTSFGETFFGTIYFTRFRNFHQLRNPFPGRPPPSQKKISSGGDSFTATFFVLQLSANPWGKTELLFKNT